MMLYQNPKSAEQIAEYLTMFQKQQQEINQNGQKYLNKMIEDVQKMNQFIAFQKLDEQLQQESEKQDILRGKLFDILQVYYHVNFEEKAVKQQFDNIMKLIEDNTILQNSKPLGKEFYKDFKDPVMYICQCLDDQSIELMKEKTPFYSEKYKKFMKGDEISEQLSKENPLVDKEDIVRQNCLAMARIDYENKDLQKKINNMNIRIKQLTQNEKQQQDFINQFQQLKEKIQEKIKQQLTIEKQEQIQNINFQQMKQKDETQIFQNASEQINQTVGQFNFQNSQVIQQKLEQLQDKLYTFSNDQQQEQVDNDVDQINQYIQKYNQNMTLIQQKISYLRELLTKTNCNENEEIFQSFSDDINQIIQDFSIQLAQYTQQPILRNIQQTENVQKINIQKLNEVQQLIEELNSLQFNIDQINYQYSTVQQQVDKIQQEFQQRMPKNQNIITQEQLNDKKQQIENNIKTIQDLIQQSSQLKTDTLVIKLKEQLSKEQYAKAQLIKSCINFKKCPICNENLIQWIDKQGHVYCNQCKQNKMDTQQLSEDNFLRTYL